MNTLFCCYLTRKWCIIFCLYVCIVEAKAREKSASLRFPSTLSMWSHSFFVAQHSIKRLFLYMNKFLPSISNIKRLNIYYETFITNLARDDKYRMLLYFTFLIYWNLNQKTVWCTFVHHFRQLNKVLFL